MKDSSVTRPCTRSFIKLGVALIPLFLTSCARAPVFDIAGSIFPAWLVCFTLSIFMTVVARWVLMHLQIVIVFEILVYPCLTAVFTFLIWLVFFS
jgi:hypothetical protein